MVEEIYKQGKNPNSRNGFKRGHLTSEETRRKIGLGNKGKIVSEETRDKIRLRRLGCPSGMLGKHHSDETKQKISKNNKGKHLWALGRKHSEEEKRKISNGLIGKKRKPFLEATKKRMSESWIKRKESPNFIASAKGIHHSEESKRKMSLLMMGKIVSEDTRRKMSLARKGKPHVGYKWTEEQKENLKKNRKINHFYDNITEETKNKMSISAKKVWKENRHALSWKNSNTPIEIKIQNFLNELKIYFITHLYLHIEHDYQVDIFIPSKNLVIECDGDYWHKYSEGKEIDRIRTKELEEKGFKILRLWEREIKGMTLEEFKSKLYNL